MKKDESRGFLLVLVVDDSRFMRLHLKKLLKQHGFTNVIGAKDGTEAIQKFEYYFPDIVILDHVLPDKDGISVLQKIKEINPMAKVIMHSSLAPDSIVNTAIKQGAMDFVQKPNFVQLIQSIEKAFIY